METQVIKTPKEISEKTVVLKTDAEKALAAAQKLVIENNDEYKVAADLVKDYIAQEKVLEKDKKKLVKPINEAKQGIVDWFKAPLDFLDKAKRATKKAMIAYDDILEEERKKAQAKLDAEAERKRKYELELAEKRAETQRKKGNIEKAEEIIEETEQEVSTYVAPAVTKEKPKVGNVGISETWSAEVVDPMELYKAVVEGRAPQNVIAPDMKVLNQMARASKKYLHVPGVKAVSKRG